MVSLDPKMDKLLRNQLREIGADYATFSKEVKSKLSTVFEKYADASGRINYTDLSKYGRLDKLKQEIKEVVSHHQTRIDNKIRATTTELYKQSYQDEVIKLKTILPDVKLGTVPSVGFTKKAVQNDLSGMVLNERLRAHRAEIVRQINSTLTQGIHRGDTYNKMAKSISEVLEGDFVKSSRIVRTEGHRVYEQARYDTAVKAVEKTTHKMMKRWVSSRDERVRASHQYMDGKEVPIDEDFVNPKTGGRGPHPGAMGTPEDDINCRCTIVTFAVPEKKASVEVEPLKQFESKQAAREYSLPSGREQFQRYEDRHLVFEDLGEDFLDEKGYEAFEYYKGEGYTDINEHLRGINVLTGEAKAEVESKIFAMDRFFDSRAITAPKEGLKVWRGIDDEQAKRLLTGKLYTDPGFMSTTTNPEVANFFPEEGRGEICNLIRLHLPFGEPIMPFSAENEILLGRGKQLRPVAVETIPKGGARNMGIAREVRIIHCLLVK